jgi:hypothetical protein
MTATNLAADDTHVYWISWDATVLRCPFNGCAGVPELVALTEPIDSSIDVLTLDRDHVYWVAKGAGQGARVIMAAPKDGSAPPMVLVSGAHMPLSIAVSDGNLYWTDTYSVGAVKTCPLTGCGGEPRVLALQQPYPQWLKIQGGVAYWFIPEDGSPSFVNENSATSGRLQACPVDGCDASPAALVSRQIAPQGLAVDASHIYWSTFGEAKSGEVGLYFDGAIKRMRRQ